MRAMIRAAIGLIGSLMITVTPGMSWYETQLTDTDSHSRSPRLVYDLSGNLHAAWQEDGAIEHRVFSEGEWGEQIAAGDGTDFDLKVCPDCSAIDVVWIGNDDVVHYRRWEDGLWFAEETLPSGGLGVAQEPRVANVGGPCAVWVELTGTDLYVLFSRRVGTSWTTPEALAGPIYGWGLSPTVNPTDVEGRLLVTWLEDFWMTPGLYGRVWNLTEWESSALIFEMWGVRVVSDEVRGSDTFTIHFASHSIQPTCPCNALFCARGSPGAWEEAESIGGGHTGGEWEWPQEVAISASETETHVVWRHETYGIDFTPLDERLIYGERSGDWSYDYDVAANRNAHDPDVTSDASGHAAVAWIDDSDGSFDVYVATEQPLVGVPSVVLTPDLVTLRPNPMRRSVSIDVGLQPSASVWVRIFSPAGQLVATMSPGAGPGRVGRTVWNGRDRRGVEVPAGVYHVVVGNDDVLLTERLVVVR